MCVLGQLIQIFFGSLATPRFAIIVDRRKLEGNNGTGNSSTGTSSDTQSGPVVEPVASATTIVEVVGVEDDAGSSSGHSSTRTGQGSRSSNNNTNDNNNNNNKHIGDDKLSYSIYDSHQNEYNESSGGGGGSKSSVTAV